MINTLNVDSSEYEILKNAASKANWINGLSIELGIREGGSSEIMIKQYSNPKIHIGIDPYGSLPYPRECVYDNEMRNSAISSLYQITKNTCVNFIFYNLTDLQFFKRFSDGVPVFDNTEEKIYDKYSIVFIDAGHTLEEVKMQVLFFKDKISNNGYLVFDDINDYYDHSVIHNMLEDYGFVLEEMGKVKASYMFKGKQ